MRRRQRHEGCARRGGRYPAGAHDGAVCAARRLRCAARSEGAPRNSLHSLRSLRSNNLGESDERSALRAPPSALRCSPPHKSPPPDTAHRAAPPRRSSAHTSVHRQSRGRVCAGSDICGAEERKPRGRARRALRVLTRRDCSSVESAANEASFATGHEAEHRREPVAQRRAAAFERRRIPARGFARSVSAPMRVPQQRSISDPLRRQAGGRE
jgi:hypothetical protein